MDQDFQCRLEIKPKPLTPMASDFLIFDIGANNGSDLPYYLHKASRVVAVEANSQLCDFMLRRFENEVAAGKLVVVNRVITAEGEPRPVDFYIHKTDHVLSTLVRPPADHIDAFDVVSVQSCSITDLVTSFGVPNYLKIDVEGYDSALLRALFENKIFPSYLSAECNNFEPFALMSALGGYKAFKLVDGWSVSRVYRQRQITSCETGSVLLHSFPPHSAGPFGEDIDGPWMGIDEAAVRLAIGGVGWRDLHVARDVRQPENTKVPFSLAFRVLGLRVWRLVLQRFQMIKAVFNPTGSRRFDG